MGSESLPRNGAQLSHPQICQFAVFPATARLTRDGKLIDLMSLPLRRHPFVRRRRLFVAAPGGFSFSGKTPPNAVLLSFGKRGRAV